VLLNGTIITRLLFEAFHSLNSTYLTFLENGLEGKGVKMGSLVLGNKATAPGADLDPETARYRRGWKI